MQNLLIVIACISLLWNHSIPQRFMQYEEGNVLCGRRTLRILLMRLAGKVGVKAARATAVFVMMLAWATLFWYFLAVSVTFSAFGLKIVALFAAILGTLVFVQDMAKACRNFAEWCYNQEDDILSLSKGCWEIILAGLVVVNIFFH
ncbi:MAG TPA: hypothetical protein VN611_17685 [Patescibacteria group bacterium]|nr:hypothetical protein [Patescibacteria group bacterium]